jgi:hypothetical protein
LSQLPSDRAANCNSRATHTTHRPPTDIVADEHDRHTRYEDILAGIPVGRYTSGHMSDQRRRVRGVVSVCLRLARVHGPWWSEDETPAVDYMPQI